MRFRQRNHVKLQSFAEEFVRVIISMHPLPVSRSDARRRGFSGLKRPMVESKMLQGTEENIKATRQRLESLYKEERNANK